MDHDGEGFAVLAKIEIRTIRVHALEPIAENGPIASIARRVVYSTLSSKTMNKIFTIRYLDKRMIRMLNIGDSKA